MQLDAKLIYNMKCFVFSLTPKFKEISVLNQTKRIRIKDDSVFRGGPLFPVEQVRLKIVHFTVATSWFPLEPAAKPWEIIHRKMRNGATCSRPAQLSLFNGKKKSSHFTTRRRN